MEVERSFSLFMTAMEGTRAAIILKKICINSWSLIQLSLLTLKRLY